jgi:hypothetical protein
MSQKPFTNKEQSVRWLGWGIWMVAGVGLVAWCVGLYSQGKSETLAGRAEGIFILCWSIGAFMTCIRGVLNGGFACYSRSGRENSISRTAKPVQFWIFVCFFSVAAVFAFIFAVAKLVKFY